MTCDDLLSRMQVKLRQVNYTNLNVDMNKFVNVDTNKYLYNHAIKKQWKHNYERIRSFVLIQISL